MIWREKRWLLITLGVLLAVNLVFFFTYRVRFEQRVESLEARSEQARDALREARAERAEAEGRLRTYREIVTNVATVYNEWWATPEERLTALLLEVRDLATRSGLNPRSISYDRNQSEREGNTTTLGISFGVQGSYDQVRRLIHLLELSEQFVIIDEISLGESSGSTGTLTLNIRLRTLFRDPQATARRGV